MKLIAESKTKAQWSKEKSICSRCTRAVSNKTYYGSSHFKGTCSPQWKTDKRTMQWELKNHRPRNSDWRWKPVYANIRKSQGSLDLDLVCPPEIKTVDDPNQLRFDLD